VVRSRIDGTERRRVVLAELRSLSLERAAAERRIPASLSVLLLLAVHALPAGNVCPLRADLLLRVGEARAASPTEDGQSRRYDVDVPTGHCVRPAAGQLRGDDHDRAEGSR